MFRPSVLTLKSIPGSLQQDTQFAINTINIIKLHTDRTTKDEGTSTAGDSPVREVSNINMDIPKATSIRSMYFPPNVNGTRS